MTAKEKAKILWNRMCNIKNSKSTIEESERKLWMEIIQDEEIHHEYCRIEAKHLRLSASGFFNFQKVNLN